jgi:hypothetical protein
MKNTPRKKHFCSKSFAYPLKAYTAYFYILEENISLYYPTTKIYTSITEIINEAKLIEQILPSDQDLVIKESAIIVPLNLQRLYPLKEIFWQKPTIHYDHGHRLRLFMKALDYLSFYNLVVTPITSNSNTFFVGALPILTHAPDKTIENFMLYSDFPVDETSKFAAIYEFGKPLTLNLDTGEAKDMVKDRLQIKIH